MIAFFLGSIPLGSTSLTRPTAQSNERKKSLVEYQVTRGKPVLHKVGEELDTQQIDFFFSEEFCNPAAELTRLQMAYKLDLPLPLSLGNGSFFGKRYVVESMSEAIQHTDTRGNVVRVEASMSLKEQPVLSLFGLLTSIAIGRAPAISSSANANPNAKR